MSRRNLLNLVLLIVVAALALVSVYEPGKEQPETVTLTPLDKQAIQRIEIRRDGAETIILQKRDATWRMLEPYALAANDFKVKELLALVNTESHAQRDLAELDKARYGLADARASITFDDGAPLRFGSTDPINNRRYVSYQGTLHLITDTFYYQLGRAATDFLDKQLLPGKANITALTLPALQLQLGDQGWQIQPARDEPVSSDRINELIDNWQYAQALKIEPWQGAQETFKARVRIERSGQTIEFGLIGREPKLVLARPDKGLQYQLAQDQYAALMQLPPEIETPEAPTPPAEPAEAASAEE